MANVYFSTDAGATWQSATGDPWPSTAGKHIVRLHLKDAPYSRRIMVMIQSTDADSWSVRAIIIKGQKAPQEAALGTATAVAARITPRRFSQETQPVIEAGELAAWHIPSTGKVWLLYNDVENGYLKVEID